MSYATRMRESKRTKEGASVQIGIRWKPSERAQIEEAARLSGEPLTVIIVNGALREAQRIIREAKRAREEPPQGG